MLFTLHSPVRKSVGVRDCLALYMCVSVLIFPTNSPTFIKFGIKITSLVHTPET